MLIRTAIFKPATQLVGLLLQEAANQIDAAYQPKPGEHRKARVGLQVQCLFGSFVICRDYYYHPGKQAGHYPADAALGLEGAYTPALARLICLEGADQSSYQQAQEHLQDTGGIAVSARQIQRVVQRVGAEAQAWQERSALPGISGISRPSPRRGFHAVVATAAASKPSLADGRWCATCAPEVATSPTSVTWSTSP